MKTSFENLFYNFKQHSNLSSLWALKIALSSCMRKSIFSTLLIMITFYIQGQNVVINNTGAAPDVSAILDIQSSEKGLLIPRLSSVQRSGIPGPANGLMVYDVTTSSFWYCQGGNWKEIGSASILQDFDTDTRIVMEETSDDDTIRFYTAGQEFAKMDGKTLHVEAEGQSVFLGKNAGASDDGSNNYNTALGYRALTANTSGANNVATGNAALLKNTTGSNNSANGFQALSDNTSGYSNTAHGSGALSNNTTGDNNTANGSVALHSNTSGAYNVASGSGALFSNTTGYYNVANGSYALKQNSTGANNVANGYYALYTNSTGTYNTSTGSQSLLFNTTGDSNVANGYHSLRKNTSGSFNVANGTLALNKNTTGAKNVAIGEEAMIENITGNENTVIGFRAGVGGEALHNATAIGANAVVNQSNSLVLGDNVNVGIGTSSPEASALLEMSSNSKGLLIPRLSSLDRAAISSPADGLMVYDITSTSFWYCQAGNWKEIGAGSVLQDLDADTKIVTEETTDEDTIRFYMAGEEFVKMDGKTLHVEAPGESVFVGKNAGASDDGSNNYNTAIGFEAMRNNMSGYSNSAHGYQALYTNISGFNNAAIGNYSLFSNSSGSNNTAIGYQSQYSSEASNQNTSIGYQTLFNNSSGFRNTSTGFRALFSNTEGNWNTAYGFEALRTNVGGDLNTAFGYQALYSNTEGSWNVAIGREALFNNTSGNSNTAIGYKSGVGSGELENATAIGANAVVNKSNSLVLGDNVNVGIGTSSPETSALLDISSTEKGLLIPRMTASERDNISDPANGLLVFVTTENMFYVYAGSTWRTLSGFSNMLSDSDEDTKILVEQSPDDDKIWFKVAGLNKWRMQANRLEPVANGGSNFIGNGAGMNDNTFFNQNVALGDSTFSSNTTGKFNTAIGATALHSNTTGYHNTATGFAALEDNTIGRGNIATGYAALSSNTEGNYNTGMGYLALWYNTRGNNNTAMGYKALSSNYTGRSNTAIGHKALYQSPSGSFNTAIGDSTLSTNNTGTHNTALGYHADVGVNNLTNATAIGANARVSKSNSLVLGNNVNVGIGTSSPSIKLHISGGSDASLANSSGYFLIGELDGNNILMDDNELMARTNGAASSLFLQQNGGDVYVGGAVVHTSDVRFKREITDLSYGLDEILQLEPKAYFWKNRQQEFKSIGLIAQEVLPIIKDIVHTKDDDQKSLSISYTELIPVLINAIKEQEAKIQEQEDRIQKLEKQLSENNKLEDRLAKLEVLLKGDSVTSKTTEMP